MLHRDIYQKLVEWKGKKGHHPLVLSGMRQTGKTFITKKFGEDNYKSVIFIDLRENKSIHEAFSQDFNVDKMVSRISANIHGNKFIEGNTLIILDEIQDCPNARSSLKYWDIDGRYDVIATGSFLGIKGFRDNYKRGIPVGYEEHLIMHPLTFKEFVHNYKINPEVLAYVQECIDNVVPIDQSIHDSFRNLYFEYLIVGGLPEAVNTFFESHDINAVRSVQKRILNSIKDDLGRYRDSKGEVKINEVLKLRAIACLKSLPSQLAREYKKFKLSEVDSKAHSDDKRDALDYLWDLGLVIKVHNIREISYPLESAILINEYKAYYSDIGLLTSELGKDSAERILNGDLGAYKGAIAENMVAVGFHTKDNTLYYYRGRSGSPEIDFVSEIDGKETLIECKAGDNKAASLKYVLNNPKKYGKHPAIKIKDTNIGIGEGFITYPIYYSAFLKEESPLIIEEHDLSNLTVPKKK